MARFNPKYQTSEIRREHFCRLCKDFYLYILLILKKTLLNDYNMGGGKYPGPIINHILHTYLDYCVLSVTIVVVVIDITVCDM